MDHLTTLFVRYRQRGDLDALGEVFDLVAPRLFGLALHFCGNTNDAEDALQATFLVAMKKVDSFDAKQPCAPWLLGILAGEARNVARRTRRQQDTPLHDRPDGAPGPLDHAERQELVANLRAQVETLPLEQRQVLLLQLQHGLQPAEIAEVLALAPGTVRMRIHRGLLALRRILPAGLGALFASMLPGQGLASVRTKVLSAARQLLPVRTTIGLATGTLGALAMKKMFALVALVATLLLAWSVWPPRDEVAPASAVEKVESASAELAAPTQQNAGESSIALPAQREPVPIHRGSLRILVTAAYVSRSRTTFWAYEMSSGDGTPAAGCFVECWPNDSPYGEFAPTARRGYTDETGELVFEDLVPGSWHVHLRGQGSAQDAPVTADSAREVAFQCNGRPVHGRVLSPEGQPIAGAAIWFANQNQQFMAAMLSEAFVRRAGESAQDGSFSVMALPREVYVGASHAGYAASRSQLLLDPYVEAGAAKLSITLWRDAAELVGKVLDAAGQPVVDALVIAEPRDNEARRAADGTLLLRELPQCTRTDAEGGFRFTQLPPGQRHLRAQKPPSPCAEQFVELAANRLTNVTISLAEGFRVTGRTLHANGVAAGNCMVTIDTEKRRRLMGQADAEGRFAFAAVPAGPITITASLGRASSEPIPFGPARPAGEFCELRLVEGPGLHGRVVGPTGDPLSGWYVTAIDADGESQTHTAADGTFELFALGSKPIRLLASTNSSDREHTSVVREGLLAGPSEVLLQVPQHAMPSCSVIGRVIDDRSQLIPGARVACGQGASAERKSVAADGTFRFERLAAGETGLQVGALGYCTRSMPPFELLPGEQRNLGDVVLVRSGTLHVVLKNEAGEAWLGRGEDMLLRDDHGEPVTEGLEYSVAPGEHTVRGIPPGTYSVGVEGVHLLAVSLQVAIRSGETTEATLELAVGGRRSLTFAGDTSVPIDAKDVLHVQIADSTGREVLRTKFRRSRHGTGNWELDHTFRFGRYEVVASTDSGRHYRAVVQVGEGLGEALQVTIPLLPR
jgi:RNA polymerase sigma factor (sigma-70 family)